MAKAFLTENSQGLLSKGLDPELIRYEPITQSALEQSYLWGSEASLYPWEDVPVWKNKDRNGFDISLWYGQELCGLCYASPKASAICIKVILLEGKPSESHPLKGEIAALVLIAISRYARMLGLSQIEIQDPAAGAVRWYKELGFDYDDQRRLVIAVTSA